MRTTKKDFETFKTSFNKYLGILGVTDWSVHFDHDLADGAYARSYYKLSDGICTIVFSTEWDDMRPKTIDEIDRLALHECLHILLAPLVAEAGERYTNQLAIDTAEHLIIRRLEKLAPVTKE